jgi:hypothetical protein
MAAAIERLRSLIYERIGGGTRSLRAKAHSSGTFLRWLASSAVLSADSDGRLLKRKCDHLFQRDVRSFFSPGPTRSRSYICPPTPRGREYLTFSPVIDCRYSNEALLGWLAGLSLGAGKQTAAQNCMYRRLKHSIVSIANKY